MILVSVVIPVYNASDFLADAFTSILSQTWKDSLEVSIFNDASTDNSFDICMEWKGEFEKQGINVVIGHNETGMPGGVGYAKNKAIVQSSGSYICFLDADDIMMSDRIELQLATAQRDDLLIVGSCYKRIPEGSTERYTTWSNTLSQEQLYKQVYTSFGPTIINPTWFCSRKVFDTVGLFCENKKGFPEDLVFFYKYLDYGGRLCKIEKPLLIYRYYQAAATLSVHEDTIWDIRIKQVQKNVLSSWTKFTIWNAGKQGRKFYRSLDEINRKKVLALCDVDTKKITKGYYTCELIKDENGKPPRIPIVHFRDAVPPFIICVKLNLTNGCFEDNLNSLNLVEGRDYYHFN